MYKELKETVIKTGSQMASEHQGMAFLMANRTRPYKNGILLESRGTLYAIADKEGIDQLYKTSHNLKKLGIKTMVDTIPLLNGKATFTDA